VLFCSFPVTILRLLSPILILDQGLFNPYYNYSIFITNIELIGTYFVTIISLRVSKKYKKNILNILEKYNPKWIVKRKKMLKIAFFFFLIAICSFYILANHSIGVLNWVKDPREGYQYHRTGVGEYYAFFLLFLSTSFSIALLYIKHIKNLFVTYGMYMLFVWLLGSKGNLLLFSIYFIIILWFKKYSHIKRLLVILLPIVGILLLINLGRTSFTGVIDYFDFYLNSTLYFEEYFNNKIDLFHGKLFMTSFWNLVPRSLYEDKPYIYGLVFLTDHFYPGAAENTHTPAFGGPIAAFADFGLIGVIISSIFNLKIFFQTIFYYFIFRYYSFNNICNKPILIYIFIFLFAPGFLTFFAFPWSACVFIFIMQNISLSNRIVIRIR
jgi:hypothetical protein